MPVNSKFLAARAAERTHRDLVHVDAVCWLPLQRAGKIFARTPLVPLTLRHQIELRLKGNAFVSRGRPTSADVFLFLWRLHPGYRAPQLGSEEIVARLATRRFRFFRLWAALGSWRPALVHRRLTAAVARCEVASAALALFAYLDLVGQDAPGLEAAAARGRPSPVAPDRSFADNLLDWLMATYGLSRAAALDFPLALGNQLYRERQLQQPDGELNVFAPSDLLLGS